MTPDDLADLNAAARRLRKAITTYTRGGGDVGMAGELAGIAGRLLELADRIRPEVPPGAPEPLRLLPD